jgi:heme oxygenase
MALRDKIAEKHDKAENHRFVKLLFSGEMPKNIYADFLFNQLVAYSRLESLAQRYGLLFGIEDIRRADLMQEDLTELGEKPGFRKATSNYVSYLNNVPAEKLMAHIYVRHFGDMYGGQMLKKVVPSQGRMYEFKDRAELINRVRSKLSDDLGDEANKAFDFVLELFDELANAYDIPAT